MAQYCLVMAASSNKPCVFCSIVCGELPGAIVLRTEHSLSFLDASPVFKGHVLVVPLDHVVTLPDLPSSSVGSFFADVQLIASALPPARDADGTFVANNNIVSQSVAHLHVHVVPRRRKDGLRGFFWPRERYDANEIEEYASRIREGIRALQERNS
jgi:histidine triad (HIT) family protein